MGSGQISLMKISDWLLSTFNSFLLEQSFFFTNAPSQTQFLPERLQNAQQERASDIYVGAMTSTMFDEQFECNCVLLSKYRRNLTLNYKNIRNSIFREQQKSLFVNVASLICQCSSMFWGFLTSCGPEHTLLFTVLYPKSPDNNFND